MEPNTLLSYYYIRPFLADLSRGGFLQYLVVGVGVVVVVEGVVVVLVVVFVSGVGGGGDECDGHGGVYVTR